LIEHDGKLAAIRGNDALRGVGREDDIARLREVVAHEKRKVQEDVVESSPGQAAALEAGGIEEDVLELPVHPCNEQRVLSVDALCEA
jgi:hypothetical protein